jgi:hypothetical protein
LGCALLLQLLDVRNVCFFVAAATAAAEDAIDPFQHGRAQQLLQLVLQKTLVLVIPGRGLELTVASCLQYGGVSTADGTKEMISNSHDRQQVMLSFSRL